MHLYTWQVVDVIFDVPWAVAIVGDRSLAIEIRTYTCLPHEANSI